MIPGDAALFAAIVHPDVRPNYYFVFYAERMESMWIMSSEEFDKEAVRNKTGKNVGKRSIWFNGKRKGNAPGEILERPKPQFDRYKSTNFARFRDITQLVAVPSHGSDEAGT